MTDTIRVLYVDDDPISLRVHGSQIEEHDRLTVVTESTVEAGLDCLSDDDIDCVLSDLDMPDRDGLDFLEAVRATDPHLPFILFSGTDESETVETALSTDATDFIPKSICSLSYQLVTSRIINTVDHHRARH